MAQSQQQCEGGLIGLILQIRNLRLREIKLLHEDHLAGHPGFKPRSLYSKVVVLKQGSIFPTLLPSLPSIPHLETFGAVATGRERNATDVQ